MSVGLVTVSRQFGSGGSHLALALGRRLGWPVLEDVEIIRRVARRLGAPERDVEASDEHVPGLAERLGASLAGAFPEVLLPPDAPKLDVARVADAAAAVLEEAAADPPIIVVGHGGMCLFRERTDALHVRVVAPVAHRTAEVARRLDVDEKGAREEIRARDADRAAYIRRHFDVDWHDPTLYHLVLNSERVGPEAAAEAIAALVRS